MFPVSGILFFYKRCFEKWAQIKEKIVDLLIYTKLFAIINTANSSYF